MAMSEPVPRDDQIPGNQTARSEELKAEMGSSLSYPVSRRVRRFPR
jgi:hypothetical protein